ncbi:gamma-crystallin M2-like isoform X1 [Festucalex cinctus]
MGKIVFYEGCNFQGRHWECGSDCADTFLHFSRCNSMRVSGGHLVAYEKANFAGYQYVVGPGDYPDFGSWMGFNDRIRSCQMFPPYRGSYKLKLFSRPDMSGQATEVSDDCPDVYSHLGLHDVYSCDVAEGFWVLYEHPDYRGRQFFLRPGEYRACGDWGCQQPAVGSLRRIKTLKPNEQ